MSQDKLNIFHPGLGPLPRGRNAASAIQLSRQTPQRGLFAPSSNGEATLINSPPKHPPSITKTPWPTSSSSRRGARCLHCPHSLPMCSPAFLLTLPPARPHLTPFPSALRVQPRELNPVTTHSLTSDTAILANGPEDRDRNPSLAAGPSLPGLQSILTSAPLCLVHPSPRNRSSHPPPAPPHRRALPGPSRSPGGAQRPPHQQASLRLEKASLARLLPQLALRKGKRRSSRPDVAPTSCARFAWRAGLPSREQWAWPLLPTRFARGHGILSNPDEMT